jgi:glucosamine-6-phosphate deaminase
MDIYSVKVDNLGPDIKKKLTVVENIERLNIKLAKEFTDALEQKTKHNELLTVICPVGPLEYKYFAQEVIRRDLSCRNLRTINMDEYLGSNGRLIPISHPLSFRRFMEETFFSHLPAAKRPHADNVIFPNPDAPEEVTELIDSIGGADICWAGFGITGHVAFNDPPEMMGEPTDIENFRNCRTRKVAICPMSVAQMAMGGTNGNLDILPRTAITIGMYEMLKSKLFNLTFMRNWHAGLWRRALLGPVSSGFPGSLLQDHPNLKITMTELAAAVPLVNTSQATGETE